MSQYGFVQTEPTFLVMPFGDSITRDSAYNLGAYRTSLHASLNAIRRTAIIGRYHEDTAPVGGHMGVDNYGLAQFEPGADAAAVPTTYGDLFTLYGTPDLALVYLGTNNSGPSLMVPNVVDPILAANGRTKILIGTLFPRGLTSNGTYNDHQAFNGFMVGYVQAHEAYGTRVFLAETMHYALDSDTPGDMQDDAIHPSQPIGYGKMADCWVAEIVAQGLI